VTGVAGLFDCLKSGRLLCEVANKVRPGIIPKIHIRPIPLMEQVPLASMHNLMLMMMMVVTLMM
jgi:hypothetical protein